MINCCMLRVYLDLQRRVLLEEEYAKTHIGSLMGAERSQAHSHSQPFNYSSTTLGRDVETSGRHSLPGQMMKMIRTPIPRRVSADPDEFLSTVANCSKGKGLEREPSSQGPISKADGNDTDNVDWTSEISHSSRLDDGQEGDDEDASSSTYHSFPISPLDAPGSDIRAKYFVS
jgi:hypothetical protein